MSMSLPLRDRWKERWENESLLWTIGSRTRMIPFTWSNIRLYCRTAWRTDVTLRSALDLAQPLLSATRSQKKRAATLDVTSTRVHTYPPEYHEAKSTLCNCVSPQIIFALCIWIGTRRASIISHLKIARDQRTARFPAFHSPWAIKNQLYVRLASQA